MRYGILVRLAAAIINCICVLLSGGCSALQEEGFAIYLNANDIPPALMRDLSGITPAEQPVIGLKDIMAYNTDTHQMMLTPDAFDRIAGLEVPVRGRTFVACVDRKPVYWGAFWTPISSISFDGVTIWKPRGTQTTNGIELSLGYPATSFYRGGDPRNSTVIIKSLEQADKLTEMDLHELPHSMKGYELYSWQQNNQWHFTLITGTNRNKTLEEITSTDDVISDDGWVNIHATGTEALKIVLGRLSRTDFTLWLPGMRDLPAQGDFVIQLPPQQIVDEIKSYATACGLDFHVAR